MDASVLFVRCDQYGQSGIFESESLYHMLMECPHPALQDWRSDLKKAVVDLSKMDETLSQTKSLPSFDESELWAVMMLCMSTESFPTQLQLRPRPNRPLEPRSASDEAKSDVMLRKSDRGILFIISIPLIRQ